MIPYGKQTIIDEDIDAVVEVLRSDFLTQGPMVPLFEERIAHYCQANFAVAVNSATSALHIACLSLDIKDGDLVWTAPITFVASANCVLYCGADIDFVDIDPRTKNISVEALSDKLEDAKALGKLPKALIVVHFGGLPCEMAEIAALCRAHNIAIIEDASHALGAHYQGEKIGNCRYSDVCIFSFHPVKNITSGEGGVAVTNDPHLAQRLELFRSHGITRDQSKFDKMLSGPWVYEQHELGFNYRISDIHAALGCSQLARVDQFIAKRRQIAKAYSDRFAQTDIRFQMEESGFESAYHIFVIEVPDHIDREQAFKQLRDKNVGVNVHYIPVHLQPYYQSLGFKKGQFPAAEGYYEKCITLPIFPKLSQADHDYVMEVVEEICK